MDFMERIQQNKEQTGVIQQENGLAFKTEMYKPVERRTVGRQIK